MLKKLYPDLLLNSIYDLNIDLLRGKGIKGIIADLDNTLVAWGASSLEKPLQEWLKTLHEAGFKLCILSNNSAQRVDKFATLLGVLAISHAVKPRRSGFRRALRQMDLKPHETAVLGDQIFTDILGGNRADLFTILVTPLSSKEFIATRFMRQLEKLVLKRLKKR